MFRVVLAFLVLGCSQLDAASVSAPENSAEAGIEQRARSLWSALLTHDAETIATFEPWRGAYVVEGQLDAGIAAFVDNTGGPSTRRSVAQLNAMGLIDVVIVPQRDGSAFVIYVPQTLRPRLENAEFLEREWLRSYFACEFEMIEGEWRLHGTFCFDETDGPYPADY